MGRVDAVRDGSPPSGRRLHVAIGTMVETPRAALVAADELAEAADFFSFGTNDLTQMTFGFSRDDVEGRVMWPTWSSACSRATPSRRSTPRASASSSGMAVDAGRGAKPGSSAASAASTAAIRPRSACSAEVGLDYVSCSPFRVPRPARGCPGGLADRPLSHGDGRELRLARAGGRRVPSCRWRHPTEDSPRSGPRPTSWRSSASTPRSAGRAGAVGTVPLPLGAAPSFRSTPRRGSTTASAARRPATRSRSSAGPSPSTSSTRVERFGAGGDCAARRRGTGATQRRARSCRAPLWRRAAAWYHERLLRPPTPAAHASTCGRRATTATRARSGSAGPRTTGTRSCRPELAREP